MKTWHQALIITITAFIFTGCAALGSFLGIAAPAVGSALGAYAQAADDAQRAAQLPATDPQVIALRSALAALAAADAQVERSVKPVECSEPVPVGAPLPPPAVDQAALDAALDARIARALDARTALAAVRKKKKPKAEAVMVDAGAEGGVQ
jgi:hypothetical protein